MEGVILRGGQPIVKYRNTVHVHYSSDAAFCQITLTTCCFCLHCFALMLLVGRQEWHPSWKENLSGEILAWLCVWSEVEMICIWSS